MVTARMRSGNVEIHDIDDLLLVAERVRWDGGSLVIEGDDGNALEVIADSSTRLSPDEAAMTDYQAFMASAGGWKGLVDADELKRRIREERRTNRPPVTLDRP